MTRVTISIDTRLNEDEALTQFENWLNTQIQNDSELYDPAKEEVLSLAEAIDYWEIEVQPE